MAIKEFMSPVPGIFYTQPSPDEPVYKQVGDVVSEGDSLCLVEVMKSFHTIVSDTSGTFKGYLVENEDEVSPGQVLLEIEISE
ncbi:acetyl-CoA carboxylase [Cocleimonas flava]|uniref:Biotin carboxyl carrier protein of acetyl-CoA carboxylase n=1 Tax=Cocleimonas flava TaxID=634765 RepID=A0A4R1EUS2_9GAMM|nr:MULTISPECIES: acetyl-CoA carboxylase [Cocleimonas]MEB8433358.1 acetyl-CoA carboxylase [Cocleimonas sp. KMM 6892]MEC4716169.1 acetyl-CoA carboxylase [Cocleimonas sp. KMM 6895]MEC4745938.1 acetyl-CoA carboxylase [Cocleimonas sp. KMM 6896]TCJ85013.1 biotin-dependent enzyme [Cocleimonas flava]